MPLFSAIVCGYRVFKSVPHKPNSIFLGVQHYLLEQDHNNDNAATYSLASDSGSHDKALIDRRVAGGRCGRSVYVEIPVAVRIMQINNHICILMAKTF